MAILVTGVAGFIGFHVTQALLLRGENVIGIDRVNNYYDLSLKEARLNILEKHKGFRFHRVDISDHNAMKSIAIE